MVWVGEEEREKKRKKQIKKMKERLMKIRWDLYREVRAIRTKNDFRTY